jgi:protein-disulfide isomerase
MKKTSLVAALAVSLTAATAFAASPEQAALTTYAKRSLPKCPGGAITLDPMGQAGPMGFDIYKLKQTSSDPSCGSQKLMLFSPTTRQILLGSVFPLPQDSRPVDQRAADQASQLLKEPMKAQVSPFPLPDRLRQVALTKQTAYGPFPYHGYIDGSEQFLIVGSRGNLGADAGKTLLEALNVSTAAVWRGNKAAKNEIIELSDFQCPTCGRAHKTIEPIIEKNLKNVHYARIDLPLFEHHEWSLFAALGARAIQRVAPAKYWTYVNYVFANQEEITKSQPFDKTLKNFCEDRDIDWKAVEKIYNAPNEKAAMLEQVSHAFDNGIISTPTYIINGQIMGYGPEGKFTIDAVKAAVGAK